MPTGTEIVRLSGIEGQGVAIAQKFLLENNLRRPLVQPFAIVCDRGDFTYYLIYPKNRLRNPSFRTFRQWLVKQTQQSARGHLPEDDTPAR